MTDDATWLAQLRAHPDDLELWLVYADWLEQQGAAPRADVVRSHHALRAAPLETPDLLRRARGFLTEAQAQPARWLAELAHPPLLGTSWIARTPSTRPNDDDGESMLRFVAPGVLEYLQWANALPGTWIQVGSVVRIELNAFATWLGVVREDRMLGDASSPTLAWRWEATLVDE